MLNKLNFNALVAVTLFAAVGFFAMAASNTNVTSTSSDLNTTTEMMPIDETHSELKMNAAPGTLIAGSVRQGDGGLLNPGTSGWSSGKISTGRYWVKKDGNCSQAGITVVSPIDDFGGQSSDNFLTTYNHDHYNCKVYIACIDRASGQLQDSNFSFLMWAY